MSDEYAELCRRIDRLEHSVGELQYARDTQYTQYTRSSYTDDGRVVVNANRVDALEVVYQKAHAVTRAWKNGTSIMMLFDKLHELSESLEGVV